MCFINRKVAAGRTAIKNNKTPCCVSNHLDAGLLHVINSKHFRNHLVMLSRMFHFEFWMVTNAHRLLECVLIHCWSRVYIAVLVIDSKVNIRSHTAGINSPKCVACRVCNHFLLWRWHLNIVRASFQCAINFTSNFFLRLPLRWQSKSNCLEYESNKSAKEMRQSEMHCLRV